LAYSDLTPSLLTGSQATHGSAAIRIHPKRNVETQNKPWPETVHSPTAASWSSPLRSGATMEAAPTPLRVFAASADLYRPAAIGEPKLAASHDGRTSAEFVSGGCLSSGPVTIVMHPPRPPHASARSSAKLWLAQRTSGVARRRTGATPECPCRACQARTADRARPAGRAGGTAERKRWR